MGWKRLLFINLFYCLMHFSVAKRCESVNTMASFLWWIVGFYWVVSGGEVLLQNAPRLYWYILMLFHFKIFAVQ